MLLKECVTALAIIASIDLFSYLPSRDRYRLALWVETQRWKFDHWVVMGGHRHGPPPQVEPFREWKRRLDL